MKAQRTWQDLTVSVFLAILGVGMLGFWATWLAQGNLRGGIATIENNQFIVFHVTAEAIAALLALVGAAGLWLRRTWGERFPVWQAAWSSTPRSTAWPTV